MNKNDNKINTKNILNDEFNIQSNFVRIIISELLIAVCVMDGFTHIVWDWVTKHRRTCRVTSTSATFANIPGHICEF